MNNFTLLALFKRFKIVISGTLLLLLVENVLVVLYPFLVGLTVNDLLAGNTKFLIILFTAFLFHLAIGVSRRLYDTRVYSKIYSTVVAEVVEAQKKTGETEDSKIIARVELLRELVDFFESDLPIALMSVASLFGAVVMLGVMDWRISLLCLAALGAMAIIYGVSKNAFQNRNQKLNDLYEKQMGVVVDGNPRRVRSYFSLFRSRAIRLSDLDAATSGLLELALIGVFVAALLLAATDAQVNPGHILATMMYVFEFYESALYFPYLLQQKIRLGDISGRMATA